jgi:hypothetical protein
VLADGALEQPQKSPLTRRVSVPARWTAAISASAFFVSRW